MLHVSIGLHCQNLSSNYLNTPEAQCVMCSHVVVHALLFTHHIVCQNNLNSVLTKSGILKSAIWHLWEPQLTSQQIPPNRHWQGLSNDTKIILIGQELTLISGMQFWIVLSKWVSFQSQICMTSLTVWHVWHHDLHYIISIYVCVTPSLVCLACLSLFVVSHTGHICHSVTVTPKLSLPMRELSCRVQLSSITRYDGRNRYLSWALHARAEPPQCEQLSSLYQLGDSQLSWE